ATDTPNVGAATGSTTTVDSSTPSSGVSVAPPANPNPPVDSTTGGTSTTATSEVTGSAMEIRGAPQSLRLSESARLRAFFRDSLARNVNVVWRSSRPDVVAVDPRTGTIAAHS